MTLFIYYFFIVNSRDLVSNDTCISTWDCVCPSFQITTGGMCPPGHYCPEGTGYPISCDGGKYCDRAKLAEPTGT